MTTNAPPGPTRRGVSTPASSPKTVTAPSSNNATVNTPHLQLVGPTDSAIPRNVGKQLVTVLSEELSDAIRHSGARELEVGVRVDNDVVQVQVQVRVQVTDDGVGFADPPRRSGLSNMEERARSLGGICSVRSSVGVGASVSWTVPLSMEKAAGRTNLHSQDV